MESVQSWLNTIGAIGEPLLILWQLIRISRRSEHASADAAAQVKVVAEKQAVLADNFAELATNTNSIRDELVKTIGELGRLAGREEMRVEALEKKISGEGR
jgi:hypothetical protein